MKIAIIGAPGTDKTKISQRCALILRFMQYSTFCVGDYAQEYLDNYVYCSERVPNTLDQVNIILKQRQREKDAPAMDFVFYDHPVICAYFTGLHKHVDISDSGHRVAFSMMCQEVLDSLAEFDEIFFVPACLEKDKIYKREKDNLTIEKNMQRFLRMFGVKHHVLQQTTLGPRVQEIINVLCETSHELKERLEIKSLNDRKEKDAES